MTLDEIIECIKEVKEDYWEDDGYGYATEDCQRITTAFDEAIERLEQTRWIPVSEKLPKADEYIKNIAKYYLVQNEYGDMLVARYTHGGYWEQIYQQKPISDEIVAWMPLPEECKPTDSEYI